MSDIRWKYVIADESFSGAYRILYCLAKSSRDSTGVSKRDTVKNAAKLAVYDAIIMNLDEIVILLMEP